MSKIISIKEFKPITCDFCRTECAFSPYKDKIEILSSSGRTVTGDFECDVTMLLRCSVCEMANELEFAD